MGVVKNKLSDITGAKTTHSVVLGAVIALVCAVSTGCSVLALNPVTSEEFEVIPITDSSRTLTFLEPMVWNNVPEYRASKGVRLLDGTYELEAEDEKYLYFRAPVPIEMRVLEKGVPVDGRDYEGGLALSKSLVALMPAVAYVSMSANRKMHVMKMGNDFLYLEGRVWEKSF